MHFVPGPIRHPYLSKPNHRELVCYLLARLFFFKVPVSIYHPSRRPACLFHCRVSELVLFDRYSSSSLPERNFSFCLTRSIAKASPVPHGRKTLSRASRILPRSAKTRHHVRYRDCHASPPPSLIRTYSHTKSETSTVYIACVAGKSPLDHNCLARICYSPAYSLRPPHKSNIVGSFWVHARPHHPVWVATLAHAETIIA